MYNVFLKLFGGRILLAQPADEDRYTSVMDTLRGEHGRGDGILGYLSAAEQRQLRVNKELRGAVAGFPLLATQVVTGGIRADGARLVTNLGLWRQTHPKAMDIVIRRATNPEVIVFLNTPTPDGELFPIDSLVLREGLYDDSIFPFLRGREIRALDISGLTITGAHALECDELVTLRAKDTGISPALLAGLPTLQTLTLQYIRRTRPNLMAGSDLSYLPNLQHLETSGCGLNMNLPVTLTSLVASGEAEFDPRRLVNLRRLTISPRAMEPGVYRFPPLLKYLSLSLVEVDNSSLDNLGVLQELELNNCDCRNLTRLPLGLRKLTLFGYQDGPLRIADFAGLEFLVDRDTRDYVGGGTLV